MNRRTVFVLAMVVFLQTIVASVAIAEEAYEVAWSRQLGTSGSDQSTSVSVDGAGNVFITGNTEGSLDGTNAGEEDAFLAKYDQAGNLLWTRQLGTSGDDSSHAVAVDAAGNAFITGEAEGSFDETNADGKDVFIAKYNQAGSLLWTRRLGWDYEEGSSSIAVGNSGNFFITGNTDFDDGSDAYLAKYSQTGNLLWTRHFGTNDSDVAMSVAVDNSGNLFISGYTWGSLNGSSAGGMDAFLVKYNAAGKHLWTRQLGTSAHDSSGSVAVDAFGNAFITGLTQGSLDGTQAGDYDAFLAKYDSAGSLLWVRQLGTSGHDDSRSVAVDEAGNAFITGETGGGLGGTHEGGSDAYLAKYNSAGNLLWTWQLGTSAGDGSTSVALDAFGNAFITGNTGGSFGGPNAGNSDVFLVKFDAPGPYYVDIDAPAGGDGSSWETAFNYLQDALAVAEAGSMIRVAEGICTPDSNLINPDGSGDRQASFQLKEGVAVKGGYAGYGTPNPNARDIELYQTILSGDLAGNDLYVEDPFDLLNEPTRVENSYHVVMIGSSEGGTCTLDGFTITGGNANGGGVLNGDGGGMHNKSECMLMLTDCTFSSNSAIDQGGAIYTSGSELNLVLTDCVVSHNSANYGGGTYCDGDTSYIEEATIMLTNCSFNGNSAFISGAGMFNLYTTVTAFDCTFSGNSASNDGGGIYSRETNSILINCTFNENSAIEGAGIHNRESISSLTDCTFISNSGGDSGGGMKNKYVSDLQLTGCVFTGNSAEDEGGGINNFETVSTIIDCTFIGNSAPDGGALYLDNEVGSTLENCIFSGNSAENNGGGIWSEDEDVTMIHCTFSGNSAGNSGGGVYMDEYIELTNCIFWGNIANGEMDEPAQILLRTPVSAIVNYCCVQGWVGTWPGTGNIDADPFFANPYINDFHLRSQGGRYDPAGEGWVIDAVTSPGIDAGGTVGPIGPEPFPNGGRINMGAYGGTEQASKSYFGTAPCEIIIAGDINGDCGVDLLDFVIMASHWLWEQ